MKKKIVSLCLVVCLLATAVIGGTLAYFTDTDEADNVMTIGSVNIEQIEQQRNYDADGKAVGLVDFVPGKQLIPIVGSAQGEKDAWGMPTAVNFVDKIVTVKNTGLSNAYVRTFVAVPKVLVDPDVVAGSTNQSENPLHGSIGNRFDSTGTGKWNNGGAFDSTEYTWDYNGCVSFVATIDGVEYLVDCYTDKQVLAPQDTTGAVIAGYYLDNDVDYDADENKYFIWTDDNDADTLKNNKRYLEGFTTDGNIHVLVATQAVQADGFADAYAAFEASFGVASATNHPWVENATTQYNAR